MTQQSRRRFLKATAAVGALAGVNYTVLAQDDGGDGTTILLGGNTPGWEGFLLPNQDASEVETNPTLQLEAGTTYTLIWENIDGQPHNIAIQDSDGNPLEVLLPLDVSPDEYQTLNESDGNETVDTGNVTIGGAGNETGGNETDLPEDQLVEATENITEQGAVQGVKFTATEEMATYICQVHPNTMVGDIEFGGSGGGSENNSSM